MCKRVFKEQTTDKGDVPFYKIGTFGGEPDAFISRELFEEYKLKFSYPEIGDMLVSASGTIGRTVEYTGNDEYFQDSNIIWFKHDERIDNSFLKCLYSIVKWSGIEGSTIKRLYNDNFLKTEFMLPSVEEQAKIGQYFQDLDHLITLHQRKYIHYLLYHFSTKNAIIFDEFFLLPIPFYHISRSEFAQLQKIPGKFRGFLIIQIFLHTSPTCGNRQYSSFFRECGESS